MILTALSAGGVSTLWTANGKICVPAVVWIIISQYQRCKENVQPERNVQERALVSSGFSDRLPPFPEALSRYKLLVCWGFSLLFPLFV